MRAVIEIVVKPRKPNINVQVIWRRPRRLNKYYWEILNRQRRSRPRGRMFPGPRKGKHWLN